MLRCDRPIGCMVTSGDREGGSHWTEKGICAFRGMCKHTHALYRCHVSGSCERLKVLRLSQSLSLVAVPILSVSGKLRCNKVEHERLSAGQQVSLHCPATQTLRCVPLHWCNGQQVPTCSRHRAIEMPCRSVPAPWVDTVQYPHVPKSPSSISRPAMVQRRPACAAPSRNLSVWQFPSLAGPVSGARCEGATPLAGNSARGYQR
jgi:hypothetical protein